MRKYEYYVDDQAGVVVCKITNAREVIMKSLARVFEKHNGYLGFINQYFLNGFVNLEGHKFSGKAICNMDREVFDEDLGKRLARARADYRVDKYIRDSLEFLLDEFDGLFDHLNKETKTAQRIARHNKEYAEILAGERLPF